MAAPRDPVTPVLDAVRALPEDTHLVLAVSGGLDSMVLLDAAARVLPRQRLVVATFDHGTGAAALAAVEAVREAAGRHGLPVECGRGRALHRTEAAWREARWRFLHRVAASHAARVVTAHTEDDQVETVMLRALRGAGARGLAGLLGSARALRPLLGLARCDLAPYAAAVDIPWVDDPANADPQFLRNRVRRDLLPALERVRPGFRAGMLALGERAAAWRREADRLAAVCCPSRVDAAGSLLVAVSDLHGYDAGSLAVLWPAIAARVGLPLDRRGTRRLAEFTTRSEPGAVMPLSGGWTVVREATDLVLRPPGREACGPSPLPLSGALRWGRWSFIAGSRIAGEGPWAVVLPSDRPLLVRSWAPADRLSDGAGAVRVKRLLADAGIPASERPGWPVVVAGDAIVWIPGVSRAPAATARSGRPGVSFRCEPSDG